MKILVIEDNPRLVERIKKQLQKWYLVETALSGHQALELASRIDFDIALLDLGLPDANGLEICKQLRLLSSNLPILVLTGTDSIESRVSLLESGADDYITKPFNIDELRARINALARRRDRSAVVPFVTVGDLIINPSNRKVSRAGQEITLRRKEFDILEYLASNPGRVMPREMIINHAWSSTSTSWPGSVDVHIKQLRDKIDRPFSYPLIKTTYGVGYMVDTPKSISERGDGHGQTPN